MTINKFSLNIIIRLFVFALAFSMVIPSSAQKRKSAKRAPAKVVQPKEDYSEWVDQPICKAMIADSMVVDITDIVNHLRLPSNMGRLTYDEKTGRTVYENDFGDIRLFSDLGTKGSVIYRQTLLSDRWSEPEQVVIGGEQFDYSYPFQMPDGQTLYFAARDSTDHDGQCLSLYTTTYDSETRSYLAPQRLPFPFVSEGNDLYYIDVETDSVSWLVSTRRQPEGKACIYIMNVKHPWEFYDVESIEPQQLKVLGMLNSIADTWASDEQRQAIIKRVKNNSIENNVPKTAGFRFVISDNIVYTQIDDFKSDDARRYFSEYIDLSKREEAVRRQNDEYRILYHNSNSETRSRLASTILESEQQLRQIIEKKNQLSVEIRKSERGL